MPDASNSADQVSLCPCPFCGSGQIEIYRDGQGQPRHAYCDDCQASGPIAESPYQFATPEECERFVRDGWNACRIQSLSDDDEGSPVGWTIVAVGGDGSILCDSPAGNRRRYWLRRYWKQES